MKCFYHSADLDGHCSGAIIFKKYPECEMIGINYGDTFPWDSIEKGEQVFMVDFSLQPFSDMERLSEICNLVWIDHHISAIKEFEATPIKKIDAELDNKSAGCELTWVYCFPEELTPLSVFLLGRYDIWDLEVHPAIMPFQWGMRLYNTLPSEKIWDAILIPDISFEFADMRKIRDDGRLLLKFRDQENEKYISACSFETEFEGLRAIAINRGLTNSQMFDSVWDTEKYDIMLTFIWRKGQWTVSLYSTKSAVDVSVIAKKYGGGGHKGAAGFQIKEIPFLR